MRVSTNIKSMVAQRYVQQHTEERVKEDMRLASGERIIRSSDDPAGLAISERMRAHIRSNSQAERNTNDSISLLQVAEGALNSMQSITSRLKELSMQAATDTVSDMDRAVIDKEFQAMKNEVARIMSSTTFNGSHVLNKNHGTFDMQVGINGDPELDRIRYDMGKMMNSRNNFGIDHIDVRSKESSRNSLGALDNMLSEISSSRAQLGSLSNRMNSVMQNLQVSRENVSSSNSKIRDADMAREAAIKAKSAIAQSASMSLLKMSNDEPGAIMKLVG